MGIFIHRKIFFLHWNWGLLLFFLGGGGGWRLFIAVSAEVILYPNFMGKCIVTLLSSVMPRVESSPQGTSNFTNEQLVRNEHVSFADLCRLNGAPQLISSLDSAPIRICYGFVLKRGAVNCPDVPLKSNWLVSQQKWCGLVLITMFCDCCVIYWNASCQEIWNQCKPYYNSNTLGPRQNGRRFADDIFKYIFLNESVWISVKILLKSVPNMMTSSNGNMFRVTGHLSGEFTGPGELLAQRPMTRSFDVSFDLRLNKRLSKQSWGWWFETQSRPLWRQCNECPINNIPSLVQIRAGVNSDFAIPIPIPIPAFSDFTIPIPIPIPELTIPIPIPIPDLQFQFQFQFRSQGGTNMPRQYIYILLLLD